MTSCKSLIFMLLFTCVTHTEGLFSSKNKDSNFGLDVLQLATKYGYPSEKHVVVTEDKYVLQMERIPREQINSTVSNRPAVLLVPGIFSGSVTFANFGPKKSLAFVLADNGYDVWLLNIRGTTYSRKHVHLDPDVDRKKYWNFSIPEIASYDISAAIDKVLLETKQESIFYVGHSLGCAGFFALLAENPTYNQKVKLMAAMAPALKLSEKFNFFTLVRIFQKEIRILSDLFQHYEVFPNSILFKLAGKFLCGGVPILQDICAALYFLGVGYSPSQLDKSQLPVMLSTSPAGSSVKLVLHSSQLGKMGRFAKYDYGSAKKNLLHYGQTLPPVYDVSKITTPISIFYGGKDIFVSVQDIEEDSQLLPSIQSKTFFPDFNHADFLWGIDAPLKVYPVIIEIMNSYIGN